MEALITQGGFFCHGGKKIDREMSLLVNQREKTTFQIRQNI